MVYEIGSKMRPENRKRADEIRNDAIFEHGVGDKYIIDPPRQTMPWNCSVCFFKAATFEQYIKHICGRVAPQ